MSDTPTHGSTGSRAAIAVIVGINALCYVLIVAGLADAPPLRFGGLRALLGGLAIFAVAGIRRQPLWPQRRRWPALLSLAFASTTLGYAAMFLSPGRAGAGLSSVLGNTQPLIAVALAAIFLQERLTRRGIAALLLGLLGVALIASPALGQAGATELTGALLALAAAAGFSVGTVIIKRMGTDVNLLVVTAWQLTLGSLPLLAVSTVTEATVAIRWTGVFVLLLVFLALGGTALTNALWFWLVQRQAVSRLSLYLFLVPVLGLALATAVYRQPISVSEGVGLLVTMAGVALAGLPTHAPRVQTLVLQAGQELPRRSDHHAR